MKIFFLAIISIVFILSDCTNQSLDETKQVREKNNGRSSIVDETNCNVKNYNPDQDCLITKYLEENIITGYHFSGVNFCTYKILGQEESATYLAVICEEYYIVDYKLQCDNDDNKSACRNLGGGRSVKDNFEEEYLIYVKDGLEKCDPSCRYVKLEDKILKTGEGRGGGLSKITINKDNDIKYWDTSLAYFQSFSEDEIEEESYQNISPEYIDKFKEYKKTGGSYKNGELYNWNKQRAEDYFDLKYEE